MTPSVECLVRSGDQLGESPIWCDRRRRLYWVDSRAPALRWFDPASGMVGMITMPEVIGSIGLTAGKRLVGALASGLFSIDPDRRLVEALVAPANMPAGHRFNDGRVDRQGRFWSGTMNDHGRTPTGTLYRFESDRTVTAVLDELVVPNSLAWSPDSKTMYFADTYRFQIFAFAFDSDAGTVSDRRIFADLTGQRGRPDGSAMDADGCLWNAEYAAGRVVRYRPDGRIDRMIELPVSNPTCCAFGGARLDTLFITSAAQRLTDEQLARQPLAGGLFAVTPGVVGLPEERYRGVS